MKIIDCFMYFDESAILEIRLNILNDFVDKFVIVESKTDHAGNKKKLNFNINNYKRFKKKIKYLIVEDLPIKKYLFSNSWRNEPAWLRENFQRNYLAKGYEEYEDNDIIMVSDIDEIPNPEKIKEFDVKNRYACFVQKNFQTKINLLNVSKPKWIGTKICKKKDLKSPQWLRNIKTKKKQFWKFYRPKPPQIIENGGWHFSFLKTSIEISKKIKSYAHQEYNRKDIYDIDLIQKNIDGNTDILNRGYSYKIINLDSSFPKYILNNQEKYNKWIS